MFANVSEDATVSTLMFRPILMAVEKAGVDPAKFAADVGLSLDVVGDRDARLPRELAVRAWTRATEVTGDDALGLHLALRAPPGMYGALEYAIRTNATAGAALEQFARYYRIVSSASELAVETDDHALRVVHRAPSTPPAAVDNLFAIVVRVGRELTGTPFVPREVRLTRTPPLDTADFEAFYRAPVRWASGENAIVFDLATRDLPLVTADSELHAALERRTEEMLAALPGDRFVQRARIAIVRLLRAGTGASLTTLAEALEVSERTLQRRLNEGKTSHSDLVDSVRHELALRCIADDLGTTEIAYLLGFSEATAFHRAFKRWTGTTLSEHRARLRKR